MKKLTKDLVIVKALSQGGMGEVLLAKKIGAKRKLRRAEKKQTTAQTTPCYEPGRPDMT